MITIKEYLDEVLNDFAEYVRSEDTLCTLKKAHFDKGRVPDYSDIHIQQLYLLRYAYAYAFEYKCMYTDLLSRINLEESIRVTSIGCGSLIDYWSLVHTVRNQCSIIYKGIDTIDWLYKIPPRDCDDLIFYNDDAASLFQRANKFSADVYIFPKSISEFSENEIYNISRCLKSDSILRNTVHFMFSLRTDSGSLIRDIRKTKIIYDRMIECGFHTDDVSYVYTGFSGAIKDKSICKTDNDFSNPNDVIDYLKELYEECKDYGHCPSSESCKNRLGRWPILNCRYAAWQIFTFER